MAAFPEEMFKPKMVTRNIRGAKFKNMKEKSIGRKKLESIAMLIVFGYVSVNIIASLIVYHSEYGQLVTIVTSGALLLEGAFIILFMRKRLLKYSFPIVFLSGSQIIINFDSGAAALFVCVLFAIESLLLIDFPMSETRRVIKKVETIRNWVSEKKFLFYSLLVQLSNYNFIIKEYFSVKELMVEFIWLLFCILSYIEITSLQTERGGCPNYAKGFKYE